MAGFRDALDPLVQGLLRPDAYDHPTRQFEVLETHISWVILTGDFAYKLKKPVNFGFVDFTTLEKRRFCCEEELRLNRRQTRDLYLAVKPVYGPYEQAAFRGSGEPIDYAVQMRQFSQADLLPNVLARGELAPELLDRLAVDVADFQQRAPRATSADHYGSNASIREVMDANLAALNQDSRQWNSVRSLREWTAQEYARCESVFSQRKFAGNVREGHGDMHLGNMILRQDAIEVFDCLEFNPALRWIDVISEVAFLVMDLADRGRPDLGWRFFNDWLMHTGDYAGIKVWAWYFVYRALVRAKVAVLRRQQADVSHEEAQQLDRQLAEYLNLAQRVAQRPPPRLILTHGVSGSGKSYWARQLAGECGWIWIRSDVERKRLFAAQREGIPSPDALYSADMTARTYRTLLEHAGMMLQNGWSVLIDATFLSRIQRQPFQELAEKLGVRNYLLSFQADRATLQNRITVRQQAGRDPSDATLEVLESQLSRIEPIQAEEGWTVIHIDAQSPDAGERLRLALKDRNLSTSTSGQLPETATN